jgi:hypothetical protein
VKLGRDTELAEEVIVHDMLTCLFQHVQQLVACCLDAVNLQGSELVGCRLFPVIVPCMERQAAGFKSHCLVLTLVQTDPLHG